MLAESKAAPTDAIQKSPLAVSLCEGGLTWPSSVGILGIPPHSLHRPSGGVSSSEISTKAPQAREKSWCILAVSSLWSAIVEALRSRQFSGPNLIFPETF